MSIVRRENWQWRAWLSGSVGAIASLILEITLLPDCVNAQPVADTTLGAEQSIVSPLSPDIDRIDGGATRGINLFHSFREFNIGTNRGAYFFVPNATIQNVLARVTGTSRSEILGVLGVRNLINNTLFLSNVNLFLINPNGIIFGPNASLDVGGSFVATTANAIQFGDWGSFSASVPELPSSLLTINPSAFLFNQLVQQPRNAIESRADLEVPDGQSLLLLGGNIAPTPAATGNILLEGNGLFALGGRVEVGSISSAGTVELSHVGSQLSFLIADTTARADIALTNNTRIIVAANGGGDAIVDGRNITLTEGSLIGAGILTGGNADNRAGEIRISATGDLRLDDESRITNQVTPNAVGQAGNVIVTATNLLLQSGSDISASTFGQGRTGNLTITVRETASFDGTDQTGTVSSGAFSQVNPGAVGDGGNFSLTARNLFVTNGAQLSTGTFGQGRAGNLTVTVRETASFDGTDQTGTVSSTAASNVQPGGIGDGGNFSLAARNLFVTNGAQLGTGTFGRGNAGNLTITVQDTASFDGTNQAGTVSSAATSGVELGAIGDGGELSLMAGNLLVANGAQLSTTTAGQGRAGNLTINVRDTASFDGTNQARTVVSGAGSSVDPKGVGNGGNFSLMAENLFVINGARLSASSSGQGKAGNLIVRVRDILQANDGTFSTLAGQSSGGAITLSARTIRLFGDSDITTSVFSGAEGGGDITLTADSIVALGDSDILAFAQDGRGGNIALNTRAFFGQNYRPAPFGTDPRTLDNNNRVDINATGAVSGIITLPDVSFIQNSLTQLPQVPIDTNTLLANSCIVRRNQPTGNFFVTGSGGLPERPGTASSPAFPTGEVQNVEEGRRDGEGRGDREDRGDRGDKVSSPSPHHPITPSPQNRPWKIGDPIVEPQGVYQLPDGQLVLSHECL